MDPVKWFREFLRSYRAIIDTKYGDRKAFFPYYEPVDVSIYLVEDPRKILPEVVVFFQKGIEELPVSGLVLADKKKIDWPRNLDDLPPRERDIRIEAAFYESFSENQYLGFFLQEAFSSEIFSSEPKDQAEMMVQKHLIKGLQRESFKDFLKITEIRKKQLGNNGIRVFFSDLSQLPKRSEEEKGDIISQAFQVLGFDAVNLERLKMVEEYRKLNQVGHVDVLAFMIPHKILVAIDEGEMNKERWFKKDTLSKTLDVLKFLGKKEDWKNVIFLAIGRRSPGIDHLEGDVRVVSLDYFIRTMQDFFEGKGGFPALGAIEQILGYRLQFFWK